MQDVTVRAAAAEDASAVTALCGELGYPTVESATAHRLALLSATPDSDAVFVASIGPRVVAWIHVAVVLSIENDPFAEIRGLVVTEALRGGGIGLRLVAAAEAWARERALPRIRVRSNVTRHRTHAFYERLGYNTTKNQRVFDKKLD